MLLLCYCVIVLFWCIIEQLYQRSSIISFKKAGPSKEFRQHKQLYFITHNVLSIKWMGVGWMSQLGITIAYPKCVWMEDKSDQWKQLLTTYQRHYIHVKSLFTSLDEYTFCRSFNNMRKTIKLTSQFVLVNEINNNCLYTLQYYNKLMNVVVLVCYHSDTHA